MKIKIKKMQAQKPSRFSCGGELKFVLIFADWKNLEGFKHKPIIFMYLPGFRGCPGLKPGKKLR
jgi:hypothetical protein